MRENLRRPSRREVVGVNAEVPSLMPQHEVLVAWVGYDIVFLAEGADTRGVVWRAREVGDPPRLIEIQLCSTATEPALNSFTASPLFI